jgi:hypothetical protein
LLQGVGDGSEHDPSRVEDDFELTLSALLRGDEDVHPSAKHLLHGFNNIRLFLAARSLHRFWSKLRPDSPLDFGKMNGDLLDLEALFDQAAIPKDLPEERRLYLRIRYDSFGAFMRSFKVPQVERSEFYKTGRTTRTRKSIEKMIYIGGGESRDQETFAEVFSYPTSAPYSSSLTPQVVVARCRRCDGYFVFERGGTSLRQIAGPRTNAEKEQREALRTEFFQQLTKNRDRANKLLSSSKCDCDSRDLDSGTIADDKSKRSNAAENSAAARQCDFCRKLLSRSVLFERIDAVGNSRNPDPKLFCCNECMQSLKPEGMWRLDGSTQKSDSQGGRDLPTKLRELAELHRSGALTDGQFEAAKNNLLNL